LRPHYCPSLPILTVKTLMRLLLAGIQTWVGGEAIHTLVNTATSGALAAQVVPALGITLPQLACFAAFWVAQVRVRVVEATARR
jgi:cytosine/uracil/thiamine/allantoin permease